MNVTGSRKVGGHVIRVLRLALLLSLIALIGGGAAALPAAGAEDPTRGQAESIHTHGKLHVVPHKTPSPAVQEQREPVNVQKQAPVDPKHRASHSADPIDLRVLVISANGQEQFDFAALTAELDRLGIPYDVLLAVQHTLNGTAYSSLASVLSDGVDPGQGGHGHYQAIMLTTGNLTYSPDGGITWTSAFTSADWAALWQYEAAFNIRQVTNYTYPSGAPTNYCLSLAPRVFINTTITPISANLTPAGAAAFSYLNTASPITIRYSWTYVAYADPNNAANGNTLTPLLTTPDGSGGQYILGSICRFADGRENLAVTAANNPNFVHTELLSYGLINWVTRGLFLGERHVSMDYQPDDLFIDDDVWNPSNSPNNSTYDPGRDCIATASLRCPTVRMSGSDVVALVNWQNELRSSPTTRDFRIEFPFNGEGTVPGTLSPSCRTGQGGPCDPDTLTPAVRQHAQQLNFISHTYSHINLDQNCVSFDTSTTPATCTRFVAPTYQQLLTELQSNDQIHHQLHLNHYSKDSFVQPDISGLDNPVAMQAAHDFGIRFMISDTSRPAWNNPSPNAGIYSSLQPSILVIPRHPSNLFFNIYNPGDWVAEYNCFYNRSNPLKCGGPSFDQYRYLDQPIDYAGIIEHESDQLLQYLLKWDIDPLMFHQPNTVEYAPGHTLLRDLVDRVLQKYNSMYSLPIRNWREHQVGTRMADRMGFNAARRAGLRAQMVPCGTLGASPSISISSPTAAVVPVTGVRFGARNEAYGGQGISYVNIAAGQTVVVPLTCP